MADALLSRQLRIAAQQLSRSIVRHAHIQSCRRTVHTAPTTARISRTPLSRTAQLGPFQCLAQPTCLRRAPSSTAMRIVRLSTLPVSSVADAQLFANAISPPEQSAPRQSFFPTRTSSAVGYWLLVSAASVFGIVVFGGLTRLTESGLSITEWKPVTGTLPPLDIAAWQSEFDKYRATPEFKLLNPQMSLEEFKQIYYMEWAHRVWGRVIGLSFMVPAVYFVARRRVSRAMAWRLLGIAGLIGVQGGIGWWMVKSGLHDDLFAPGSHPRVSQYRLTAHLGTAFLCYIAMLTSGMKVLRSNALSKLDLTAQEANSMLRLSRKWFAARSATTMLIGMVFLTAMSGGLVAGLDAGLIYNSFPHMGEGYAPPMDELFSSHYSRQPGDLWWRNLLENPSTVQLQHRILAISTYISVMAASAWIYMRHLRGGIAAAADEAGLTGVSDRMRDGLASTRRAVWYVVAAANTQVLLGISTLIYLVPVPLAAMHQAGSLLLLTSLLWLRGRAFGLDRRVLSMLRSRMARDGKGGAGRAAMPAQRVSMKHA